MIDLPALLLTVDAIRGAIVAVLCGDLELASRQLAEARKAAEHAYPLDSRESYGLELVLESITEAAVMTAALTALLAFLAAFVFCVLASTVFGWHPAVTRPATAVCALGLIACGAWLNRSAS